MANLVGQVDNENEAELQARKPEGVPPQVLSHKINWNIGAKVKYRYNAYLVQVSDITQTSVTFQFVNHNTGIPVGTSHKLDLDDFSKMYRFTPSTLPTPAELGNGNNVSFLMLNELNLGDLKADAALVQVDDGKWPRVTLEPTLKDENAKLKGALKRLLQMPTTRGGISSKDREDYEALVGA